MVKKTIEKSPPEDDYKIVAVINKKKYTLNKVGSRDFMTEMKFLPMQKIMLKNYVASNFRDVMTKLSDLTSAKYYHGKKVLFSFKYSETDDDIADMLKLLK